MAWAAVAVGVGSAVVSAYGQHKANQQAKDAAKAASGPTTETVTRTPWGPTEQPRIELINRAMGLLGGGQGGNGGGGNTFGSNFNLASFSKAILADPNLPQKGKDWIIGLAKSGNLSAVQQNLGKMPLSSGTKAALGLGGAAAGARRPGGGGSGAGGGGGAGGAGGGGGGGGINYNAYIRKFLNGDYITANPYIDSVVADLQDEYNRQGAADALSQRTNWRTGSDAAALENSLNLGQLLRSEGQVRAADYNARQAERAQVMGQALGYDAQNRATNAQRAVGMAGVSVQRGYLRNAQAMLPYQQLGSVADILNAAGGQYGTTTSVTQGPQRVAQTQSPLLAGVQGGLAGYSLANSWGAGGTNWGGTKIPSGYT